MQRECKMKNAKCKMQNVRHKMQIGGPWRGGLPSRVSRPRVRVALYFSFCTLHFSFCILSLLVPRPLPLIL